MRWNEINLMLESHTYKFIMCLNYQASIENKSPRCASREFFFRLPLFSRWYNTRIRGLGEINAKLSDK